jgi:hypothetical protein
MRDFLIVLVALVLSALGLGYFAPEYLPAPVQKVLAPAHYALQEQARKDLESARVQSEKVEARAKENPPLYQWRDDAGVIHVTDTPPKGRPYEVKRYHPDTNVIPAANANPANQ